MRTWEAGRRLPGRTLVSLTSVSDDDLGEELTVVWEVEPGRTHDQARATSVREALQYRLDRWYARRQALQTGHLGYKVGVDVTGLLREPDEGSWGLWSVPMSMREVEAEVLLQLDRGSGQEHAPAWSYDRPARGEQS